MRFILRILYCSLVQPSYPGSLAENEGKRCGLVLVDFDTGLNLSKAAGLASGQRVPRRTTLAPVPLTSILSPPSARAGPHLPTTCPPYRVPALCPVQSSPTDLPSIHRDQTRPGTGTGNRNWNSGTAPLLALASSPLLWHHLFSVRLRLAQKSRQVIPSQSVSPQTRLLSWS